MTAGGKLRHKGYQRRTLIELNGPIMIQRARYRCSKTGKITCPLDEVLDLASCDVTVSLARRALRLGTYTSFAALQEELKIQHDVRLSDSTLNLLMQAAGGTAERDRQEVIDKLKTVPIEMHREQAVTTLRPETEQAILDKLIGYVRPRLATTDYVDYKAAGYVIGSGMMEETCKQLGSLRLKGTGMQWSESGALAMTALIAHRINRAWGPFWASCPLQRTA